MISSEARDIISGFPATAPVFSADPADIQTERQSWDESCPSIDGLSKYWINDSGYFLKSGPPEAAAILIYAHGGAFRAGSARTHQALCRKLADAAGIMVYNVNYSLAPEHPYPHAIDEIVAVYRDTAVSGTRLFLGGDSAGGCLAAAAALRIIHEPLPQPQGMVLISPWLDLDGRKYAALEPVPADPFVSLADGSRMVDLYTDQTDRRDPLLSPAFAKDEYFPPTLILAGGAEVLVEDARQFLANNHRTSEITLSIYEGMWHVWPAWDGLPEANRAISEISAFIRSKIK